jgi:hypothetical protein
MGRDRVHSGARPQTAGRRRVAWAFVVALSAALIWGAPFATGTDSGGAGLTLGPVSAGRAVWITDLARADGGNIGAISAQAHLDGVSTLLIKSSDGTTSLSQFTSDLVDAMHAVGLRVCAWQFVYGNHPVAEAQLGAAAVHDGADCLVIDAESEYQRRYAAAQTYIHRLRALIGYRYPLALSSFPLIVLHPTFPYSVFLGPGGAQTDMPQMYWHSIGVSTDAMFAQTYAYNLVYGRPIVPLGQLYGNPPARQIARFRRIAHAYRAAAVTWFDWEAARPAGWAAISAPVGPLPGQAPHKRMADVGEGARGDLVVWAQEHLLGAGRRIAVSGVFGPRTLAAVEAFQAAHAIAVDGIIGPATWAGLLRYRAARIDWRAVRRRPA